MTYRVLINKRPMDILINTNYDLEGMRMFLLDVLRSEFPKLKVKSFAFKNNSYMLNNVTDISVEPVKMYTRIKI